MKTVLMLSLLSLLLPGLPTRLQSQDPASVGVRKPQNSWRQFSGKDEDFSVLMPGEPSLYINLITTQSGARRVERIYGSFFEGSVYLVVSYDSTSAKEILNSFKAHHLPQGNISFEADMDTDGRPTKQYALKAGDVTGTLQIHSTKRKGYAVAIVQAVHDPASKKYFLSSFSVANKGTISVPKDQPPIPVSALPVADTSLQTVLSQHLDRKAVVVSKPEPVYTAEARQAGIQGTVVLRAVLSSSGEVTQIRLIRGLPNGLTENAVEAARNLKFIPAVKDNHFVSYHVQLEYNFNLLCKDI